MIIIELWHKVVNPENIQWRNVKLDTQMYLDILFSHKNDDPSCQGMKYCDQLSFVVFARSKNMFL